MGHVAAVIGRLFLTIGVFLGTLVAEILLAMLLYMYLATNHVELFGELVRFARDGLNIVIDLMESWIPDLSNRAYASLVGEIAPKSFLLLVLGLLASGVIRIITWTVLRLRRHRRSYAQ